MTVESSFTNNFKWVNIMKVYQAINMVQNELAKVGISKNRTNTQGASYKFRGIDDVFNSLSPIMARFGLCILPRVLSRNCVERQSKSGGVLFYVTLEVEFDFVCATDGSKHTVKTFGEAMDSSDKATNKAMSAAYKYAALQAFAIPTEGDNDADAHTPEIEPPEKQVKAFDLGAALKFIAAASSKEELKKFSTNAMQRASSDEEKNQIIKVKTSRELELES